MMKTTFGRSGSSFCFAAAIQMVLIAMTMAPETNKNHDFMDAE